MERRTGINRPPAYKKRRRRSIIDCISAILDGCSTPEKFLNRKSMTRDVLGSYLQRKGIILSAAFKGAQIGEIWRMWNDNPQQQVM